MSSRRGGAWARILERADDELVAALDSLAALFRGGERAEGDGSPDLAELHKRAWALGLRVALASDDVVLLDPDLRDEAQRIGGLWRELHPEKANAPAKPANSELLRKVEDLKTRLAALQERIAAPTTRDGGGDSTPKPPLEESEWRKSWEASSSASSSARSRSR